MKVAIVGDTHSDGSFVSKLHKLVREFDVHTIIQLGDFGFTFDKNMMASIYAWLDKDEQNEWYWLDGNHDQHDYIEQTILAKEYSPDVPVSHFHERMFYCPRGSVKRFGETTCMFLGGAYSIDKMYRKAHVSWWPQELITYGQAARAINNGEHKSVDVLFSHDAVLNPDLESMLDAQGYKVDSASKSNRELLATVAQEIRPHTNYHGHYHLRYSGLREFLNGHRMKVEGLGANVEPTGHSYKPPLLGDNVLFIDL